MLSPLLWACSNHKQRCAASLSKPGAAEQGSPTRAAMATLQFPPPPPQQLLPYSTSLLAGPSPPRSAYTPTFIVLAVIAALAVIACVLGQVWARRYLRPRRTRGYDVEEDDDFGMNTPAPKPAAAVDGTAKGEAGVAGGGARKAGRPGDDDGGPRV